MPKIVCAVLALRLDVPAISDPRRGATAYMSGAQDEGERQSVKGIRHNAVPIGQLPVAL